MTEQAAIPAEASLFRKLAEVMAEVGRVEKRGRNTFHGYAYVTEGDLVEEVRAKLAARSVALIPSVHAITERPYTTSTERGVRESVVTTAHLTFTFVDGDTGATFACEWAGQGDDPADKGLYSAYTGGLKYFLMKTFLVPTGNDPEANAATDERGQNRASSGQRRSNGRAGRPSDAQKDLVVKVARQKGATVGQLQVICDTIGANVTVDKDNPDWMNGLTGGRDGTASALITFLKENPLPSLEHPSDVPGAEPGEFVHEPDDGKGTPMELHG